ncbi:MAG: FAD-dependent monooxygenase, partial [Kutzneria sp.]|nr:FAD-dependent monooxygenase [Kutzneria sp.]
VRIRVVDAADGPFPGSRGKGVQPRTLEVFDDLGIVDKALSAGRTDAVVRYYERDRLLGQVRVDTAGPARADVPYLDLLWIPQWRVDQILSERLVELGVTVEYGTALVDLHQHGDRVTADLTGPHGRTRIDARYLVGADGGHSRTRKLLGVGFDGEPLGEERMVLADVCVEGLDPSTGHVWLDQTGLLALTPFTNTRSWQVQASVHAGADGAVPEATLATVRRIITERTAMPGIRVHDATWLSLFRTTMRMVDRYRVGRVFLAGDAAHVHSPAGAQGMNTGIQDGYNLGWKLAAVLARGPESLLDTYQRERLPVAKSMLALTAEQHRKFRAASHAADVVRMLTPQPGVGTDQLSITYRGSALAVDLGDADRPLRAGDRAPDAPLHDANGSPTRLFDVFRGTHLTLLAFGRGHDDLLAFLSARYGAAVHVHRIIDASTDSVPGLVDAEGHAAGAYHAEPGALRLIRPDGYVGLASDDPGPATRQAVEDYLAAVTAAGSPARR